MQWNFLERGVCQMTAQHKPPNYWIIFPTRHEDQKSRSLEDWAAMHKNIRLNEINDKNTPSTS